MPYFYPRVGSESNIESLIDESAFVMAYEKFVFSRNRADRAANDIFESKDFSQIHESLRVIQKIAGQLTATH